MVSKFRVRFVDSYVPEGPKTRQPRDLANKRRKSRFACLECKKLHLKCDETFPVCLRCQKRGTSCHSPLRSAQWQIEIPGVTIEGPLANIPLNFNHRLIQYWLEKASQIMVIDPDINPFSFDILQYLETSQSLIHGIQSLSLAHEDFFGSNSLTNCLRERGRALALAQKELQDSKQISRGTLLSVLLLGLSSAWVHHQTGDDFGQEHLRGARGILDILLAKPESTCDPFIHLAVAWYLLWDQATAFLHPSSNQVPLYSLDLLRCVLTMSNEYNAIVGYLIEIMYILGDLGRYCRCVIDSGVRNLDLEASFEEQLLASKPAHGDFAASLVNESFRKHGLIMLYRTIETAPPPLSIDFIDTGDHEDIIRQYTTDILHNIDNIPDDCHYHCILAQPLLTAGSELSQNDSHLRDKVQNHFRKLFSLTRIPTNLHAVEFLKEVWDLSDRQCHVFWMSHLLKKDRIFVVC